MFKTKEECIKELGYVDSRLVGSDLPVCNPTEVHVPNVVVICDEDREKVVLMPEHLKDGYHSLCVSNSVTTLRRQLDALPKANLETSDIMSMAQTTAILDIVAKYDIMGPAPLTRAGAEKWREVVRQAITNHLVTKRRMPYRTNEILASYLTKYSIIK